MRMPGDLKIDEKAHKEFAAKWRPWRKYIVAGEVKKQKQE